MDTVVSFTFYGYKENVSSLCLSLLSAAEKELTECGGYLITAKSDGQTVELNAALASVAVVAQRPVRAVRAERNVPRLGGVDHDDAATGGARHPRRAATR